MIDWLPIPTGEPKVIEQVFGAVKSEPRHIYSERYTKPVSEMNEYEKADAQRYIQEVLTEFAGGCSVLLFGSGHHYYPNTYYTQCKNIKTLHAMDFVFEAGHGLFPEIEFFPTDILHEQIPQAYDYVFTTHTIEHFTRFQILNIVVPKLCFAARKAVVILTPYADNWGDEPTHRCRLYEDDELAALATKYKRIRDNPDEGSIGIEIVYWLEGRAQ